MHIESIDRAHQSDVSITDQFHQRQPGPKVLSRDTDHQTKIGAKNCILRRCRRLKMSFQRIQIAHPRRPWLQSAACIDELKLVIVELKEQRPLTARRQ